MSDEPPAGSEEHDVDGGTEPAEPALEPHAQPDQPAPAAPAEPSFDPVEVPAGAGQYLTLVAAGIGAAAALTWLVRRVRGRARRDDWRH